MSHSCSVSQHFSSLYFWLPCQSSCSFSNVPPTFTTHQLGAFLEFHMQKLTALPRHCCWNMSHFGQGVCLKINLEQFSLLWSTALNVCLLPGQWVAAAGVAEAETLDTLPSSGLCSESSLTREAQTYAQTLRCTITYTSLCFQHSRMDTINQSMDWKGA